MLITSYFSDGINAVDSFSYLLASQLLQQSLKYGQVFHREISELMSLCLIGCDIYSVIESENFLKSKAEFDRNVNF